MPVGIRADVNLVVDGDENGIRTFQLAVGDFYKVSEHDVTVARQRQIPNEEIPVVFFLAQRAGVDPTLIIDLRLGGRSWMDITYYYGMGADIYYVKSKPASGPPYGKAIGYYKNVPHKEWKYIKLANEDVINLVNLRFISSYYGCPTDKVMKMRSNGKTFVDINKDIKAARPAKSATDQKPGHTGGHSPDSKAGVKSNNKK
jgi:hypothetical protein